MAVVGQAQKLEVRAWVWVAVEGGKFLPARLSLYRWRRSRSSIGGVEVMSVFVVGCVSEDYFGEMGGWDDVEDYRSRLQVEGKRGGQLPKFKVDDRQRQADESQMTLWSIIHETAVVSQHW